MIGKKSVWKGAAACALMASVLGVFGAARLRADDAKPTKATGKVIGTEGSYQDGGADRSKAFDGDTGTFFDAPEATNGNGVWVGLDLGEGKDAQVVKIRYFPRGEFPARMVGGKFQGSSTADFSKDVVDLHTITAEPFEWMDVTKIDSDKKFRYLRYLSPDDGWGNVSEIEFLTK